MKKYELGVILKPTITAEEKAEQIEKVKSFITKVEGVVTNVEDWGKKELAYEIEKVREGYYVFLKFTSSTDAIAKIENDCRLVDSVIRYLIVSDDFVEAKPSKKPPRKPRTEFKKPFVRRDNRNDRPDRSPRTEVKSAHVENVKVESAE